MKNKVGITIDEITHLDIYVYECSLCGARDYDSDKCFWCEKMKADLVKEHHKEEAQVGLI